MSELGNMPEADEAKLKELQKFTPQEKELMTHAVDGERARVIEDYHFCLGDYKDTRPEETKVRMEQLVEHQKQLNEAVGDTRTYTPQELVSNAKEYLGARADELEMLTDRLKNMGPGECSAENFSDKEFGLIKECVANERMVGDTAKGLYEPPDKNVGPMLAYERLDHHLDKIDEIRCSSSDLGGEQPRERDSDIWGTSWS